MEVVILCGGKGARLREYTEEIPKPLVIVGNKPILWHIMKYYSCFGHKDFILCLGYKGEMIRDAFKDNKEWNITFLDTGLESNKGQRLKLARTYIKGSDFLVAYGDDLANVDIKKTLELHKSLNKTVTLTAVQMESQFGILEINQTSEILNFKEKPMLDYWINGGFFVMKKTIFEEIQDGWDLEKETFNQLVKKREIIAYKHKGFWKCMNTFKDAEELNQLWNEGKTPWKIW
ncbi:MAG: sugar phosphate nucleotidyltransferase [Candidatus Woesearchaeota archaeon]